MQVVFVLTKGTAFQLEIAIPARSVLRHCVGFVEVSTWFVAQQIRTNV